MQTRGCILTLHMVDRSESYLQKLSEDDWEELFCEIGDGFYSPRVVDWELTGTCPYRCEWCWGPDHLVGLNASMTTIEITRSMTLFAVTNNNPRFVLTGGEPMTRPDIVDIVDHSCGSVDETVLSTTGDMLLSGHRAEGVWQVLGRRPHASTVAVPLHAASAAVNALVMPKLSGDQVERSEVVTEVLGRAQSLGILATLRTTITGLQTSEDVLRIPETLEKRGLDLSKIRWKLYQYDPYVGPRSSDDVTGKYSLTDQNFNEISSKIMDEFCYEFDDVSSHPIHSSADNYVIVAPNGEVRIVESTDTNLPTEQYLCTGSDVRLNITKQPVELMSEVERLMPLQLWDTELVEDEDLAELPHYRR